MNKNQGFTLIELLVVVLIIGILAAVALPQYEKAVMKTRAMSFMPMLRAIDSAEQVYYMANGTYTISFDDLDISMPAGGTVSHASGTSEKEILTYQNWECYLRRSSGENSASAYCYSTLPDMPKIEKYFSRDNFVCWGGEEGSKGYNLCKSLSNRSTSNSTSLEWGKGFTFN